MTRVSPSICASYLAQSNLCINNLNQVESWSDGSDKKSQEDKTKDKDKNSLIPDSTWWWVYNMLWNFALSPISALTTLTRSGGSDRSDSSDKKSQEDKAKDKNKNSLIPESTWRWVNIMVCNFAPSPTSASTTLTSWSDKDNEKDKDATLTRWIVYQTKR